MHSFWKKFSNDTLVFVIKQERYIYLMKRLILTWYLIHLSVFSLLAKGNSHFSYGNKRSAHQDSIKPDSPLSKLWKYHSGDDMLWAQVSFDDSKWDTINPKLIIDSIPKNFFIGSCWFRAKIRIDSVNANKILGIDFSHNGASEIYYDGRLIHRYGKVSGDKESEESYMPDFPLLFASGDPGQHLFAIRYSNHKFLKYHSDDYEHGGYAGIRMEFIDTPNDSIDQMEIFKYINLGIAILLGLFLTLSLVHLLLFLFYRQKKQNLYYSIFSFSFALLFVVAYFKINATNPGILFYVDSCMEYVIIIHILALVKFLHSLFMPKGANTMFIIACTLGLMYVLTIHAWQSLHDIVFPILILLGIVEYIRSLIVGFRRIRTAAKIIGIGSLIFIGILILLALFYYLFTGSLDLSIFSHIGKVFAGLFLFVFISIFFPIITIPISMSFYLAYDFAITNKNLKKKLVEVEALSAKTISQEKEKQEILSQQKEKLEVQVAERTKEISEQKKVIEEQKQIVEEKNKDITDSILYAKRIQQAKLPKQEEIKSTFPQSFVLFKPKDIVSGDFYYFTKNHHGIFIAAADCTGHGVPGAFMSIIGSEKLDDAVSQSADTSEILKQLNKGIKTSLRQSGSDESTRDGMDIAICRVDLENRIVKYAGANRPLWLIRKGCTEVEEIKATKTAIGGLTEDTQHFETHEIKLQQGDTFYIFSDGYADTFSGQNGQKLMTKNFKEILLGIQDKTMQEQEKHLDVFIENWKAGTEQVDDILVIGVRL